MSPWVSGPLLGLAFGVIVVLVNLDDPNGASVIKSGVAAGAFFGFLMTAYLMYRRAQEARPADPAQEPRPEHESHQ